MEWLKKLLAPIKPRGLIAAEKRLDKEGEGSTPENEAEDGSGRKKKKK